MVSGSTHRARRRTSWRTSPGDLVVAAEEHLEQVSPAHDAEQRAGWVEDRQPLDLVAVQQPGRLGEAGVGGDGDGWGGHQLHRGVAGRLGPGLAPAAALQQPSARGPLGELLLGEQVGLGDDPDHPSVGVQDRHRADAAVGQQLGDLFERGVFVDGDHIAGHHISYAASHGNLQACSGPGDHGPTVGSEMHPGGDQHPVGVAVIDVIGQSVLDPDHALHAADGANQEREEAAPLDPALQDGHALVTWMKKRSGSIMNSPTITSSMISRRMASSGRLNTFNRSLRLTIPTSRPLYPRPGVA